MSDPPTIRCPDCRGPLSRPHRSRLKLPARMLVLRADGCVEMTCPHCRRDVVVAGLHFTPPESVTQPAEPARESARRLLRAVT